MPDSKLVWIKAQRSNTNGAQCVEVAQAGPDEFYIRNSRFPQAGPLPAFTRVEIEAFFSGVREGDFDPILGEVPATA